MQWLTAILAFATTMLIFSMIVSTLVETIHRAVGSRSFGLRKMLEHFYREVMSRYGGETQHATLMSEEDFVAEMMRVRGTAISPPTNSPSDTSGAGQATQTTWSQSWTLMTDLPVESFMERLGSSAFPKILDETFAGKPDEREQALKDIAQKFELYGQEAGIYFERKARSWSVATAMFVAWFFFVHPYDLIQTFLKQPEVAAKVAELSDDKVQQLADAVAQLEQALPASDAAPAKAGSDDAASLAEQNELQVVLEEIEAELEEARKTLEPLKEAGVPIGWSLERTFCLSDYLFGSNGGTSGDEAGCWIKAPNSFKDLFWLAIGGLLVGLGAPFWAKAIRQVTNIQGTSKSLAQILKPEAQPQANQGQQAGAATGSSVATEAFNTSATAPNNR